MQKFKDAVALITGAASGIGAAVATRIANSGARKLILVDRSEDRLHDFAFSLPCERALVIGDVADPALWREADLTGLTNAVVNAGIASAGPIEGLEFEEWRRIMSVNLDGAFLTLQAAMRSIRSTGGGSIVLTGSAAGIKAERDISAYASSKAGVIQLARVAAKEGASQGIRVNVIAPGGVETPIWDSVPLFADRASEIGREAAFAEMAAMATPLKRYAKPEEIAAQISFLLSDECAGVTGTVFVSDGGYTV
ncbi:MAG TPA: SDR family NAD(P)-dependent oxidoreductase [Sphingomicrobium sp.]|nr:SDR family NAD(P)-dependent oxidoreductase [Sphingomicrobium sp.]